MEILSLEIMECRFYNFWYRDGSTMVALACTLYNVQLFNEHYANNWFLRCSDKT